MADIAPSTSGQTAAPPAQPDPTQTQDTTQQPVVGQTAGQQSPTGQTPIKAPDQTVNVQTHPQQIENPDENQTINSQIPKQDEPKAPDLYAPQDNAQHPAVQKASLLHDVALALAGGPHFSTSIDPNTGQTTRTQIPMSGKQIAMAIALEALGGGIAGLGAKGSNNEGEAVQAGFSQGAHQAQAAQAAQQQQAQQASTDYARQAAITQTNFQTHRNAMLAGQMDLDQHKGYVADAAPVLGNLQEVGAIKASGVHESDLLAKYHVTKDMAVVDGTVPRMNPDGTQAKNTDGSLAWDNTYSVIDPEAQVTLPEETANLLAQMHVPGYFRQVDGKTLPINLPDNTQMKARMVVDGLATASAIRLTEGAVNNQLTQLADPDDQKKVQVNLADGLESGRVTPKALKTFANFSQVPFSQLQTEMQKAKIDPDTIGQVMSLIPQGAIDASKKQVADQAAKIKADEAKNNLVVTKNNYGEVLADPKAFSQEQVQAAQSAKKQDMQEKAQEAYSSGANHEQGSIDVKKKNGIPLTSGAADSFSVSDPKLAPLVTSDNVGADGINHKFLDAMATTNPQRANLVQAIVHGQRLESFYGLAKKDGQALAADVSAADPSFDQSKVQEYNKTALDFSPAGKTGQKLVAANTALKHLSNLFNNTTWGTGIGSVVGGNNSPFHVAGLAARKADQEAVASELAKYYKGGAPDKEAVAALHDVTSAVNPNTAKDGARELAKLLHGGIDSTYESWKGTMPSNFVPKQAFFDADGAKAYEHITGEKVDPKYRASQTTPGGGSSGQPQFSHVSASGKFGWNGTQWIPIQPQQQ